MRAAGIAGGESEEDEAAWGGTLGLTVGRSAARETRKLARWRDSQCHENWRWGRAVRARRAACRAPHR